jgi:hypothetical protein
VATTWCLARCANRRTIKSLLDPDFAEPGHGHEHGKKIGLISTAFKHSFNVSPEKICHHFSVCRM